MPLFFCFYIPKSERNQVEGLFPNNQVKPRLFLAHLQSILTIQPSPLNPVKVGKLEGDPVALRMNGPSLTIVYQVPPVFSIAL